MHDSPNPPKPSQSDRSALLLTTLSRTGPVIGGVVLGMGLTILPLALDRAGLASPLPQSLSWHHPDRKIDSEVARHRAHRYVDLEIDLVERALSQDTSEPERARILDYLAVRGADADLRQWAAGQPVHRAGPAIEVEPIAWGHELSVALNAQPTADTDPDTDVPPSEPPQADVAPEPATGFDFLGMWREADRSALSAVVQTTPDVEPDTEVVVAGPEPVAAEPTVVEAPPVQVEDTASDAVAEAPVARGPVQAAAADNRVFIDLERGEADTVVPAITGRVGQLVQCYESTLEFDPDLTGHVEVEWHVANGRVNAIQVGDESLGDEITLRCMTERIRRWRFEPDVTGMVAWRFAFTTTPG